MAASKIDGRCSVLLVEDNEGDVVLVREALAEGDKTADLHVVRDGLEALAFLRHEEGFSDVPRPDVILLDLNLPKLHGSEVLHQLKRDRDLRSIPVVILSTSSSEADVRDSYLHRANCYITKPSDFDHFVKMIHRLQEYWFEVVSLPPQDPSFSRPVSH